MIRRTFFIFLLLLCGTLIAFSQARLDSLKTQLDVAKKDSIRFLILIKMSAEAEYLDYALSTQYAQEASKIADRIDQPWAKGRLFLRLGFLETLRGNYAEALKYHLESLKQYSQSKDSVRLAQSLVDVGSDYRDMGEYEEGYLYMIKSYQMAKKHSNRPSSTDSLTMAIALHNIGTVFTELGQFDVALGHFKASAKISEDIDDEEGLPYTCDEIGELYRRKGDFKQAEKYLFTGLKEARRQKIRFLIPRIQSRLANLYYDTKDYPKSLLYYDSVIVHEKMINNRFGLAECALGKGKVMSRLGNFDQAQKLYASSLATSKELNARNLELLCYKELGLFYEMRSDFAKSLYYFKQHVALRDSIFSGAAMEKLSQNQVRFELDNKNSEIEELSQARLVQNSEIKRQELISNILVIVIALTVILLFTVYRSGSRRKRINGLLLEHQEEIKKRSVELEQLNQVKDKFFSIISHDLRSPMNALAGTLDLLEQKHISPEEFRDLSKNLRTQFNHTRTLINNLLNWTLLQMDKLTIQPEKVSLHSKVEESFATIRMLYPKNIHLDNHVNESMMVFADANIINLVLRNLILNAVKFTESGGKIWIDAKEETKEIVVSVSDNGIGIKPEVRDLLFEKTSGYSTRGTANEKGTGLGLILCKEFVEKNGGRIWLESELGKGTVFYFTLPKA